MLSRHLELEERRTLREQGCRVLANSKMKKRRVEGTRMQNSCLE